MAAKTCVRCGAEVFGLVRVESDIHVCKDIAARLARRERQVRAVEAILDAHFLFDVEHDVAVSIVKALAGLGVADD